MKIVPYISIVNFTNYSRKLMPNRERERIVIRLSFLSSRFYPLRRSNLSSRVSPPMLSRTSTYKALSTMDLPAEARKVRSIPIVGVRVRQERKREADTPRKDAFFTTVIPFLTARKQPWLAFCATAVFATGVQESIYDLA